MTFITGALILVIASFIAIAINDRILGGDLPDEFFQNKDDNSSSH